MPYTPILATLGYVFSPCGEKVLLIHRNARPDDPHFGKFNGLGGKLERGEDVVAGMRREIREEAGIECEELRLVATINWPGFGKNGEDWFGFLFQVTKFTGTPLTSNAEGELVWVTRQEALTLPMWEGDKHFLPQMLNPQSREFHGVMPYEAGRPVGWSYSS
jgi:8-oxo-dGTP diphosphatase